MDILIIFGLTYAGLIFGRLPWIQLDRTGIALVGAIAMLVFRGISLQEAVRAVDFPTVLLLFAMMVISAQLRLAGFYSAVTRKVVALRMSPGRLLGVTIFVSGFLSAALTNDVVCLAIAPILLVGTAQRGWNPVPFLLGLACASNIGSAATIIGNPQNILIGQALDLSFSRFLLECGIPSLAGLGVAWALLYAHYRRSFSGSVTVPRAYEPAFSAWQSTKGLGIATVAVIAFFFSELPREIIALTAAGVLLMSRRLRSRDVMELVDWHLLVLFVSLFIINRTVQDTSLIPRVMEALTRRGVDPASPGPLFVISPLLSNLVSNVPAVMFLLPFAQGHKLSPAALALSSTLAGNLLIIGSIANIIVVEQSKRLGVPIGWKEHARVGLPVTVFTLLLAAAWLWAISAPL
jgi:Na+/H+ antiporter NhaD/arsenite permease-like protein